MADVLVSVQSSDDFRVWDRARMDTLSLCYGLAFVTRLELCRRLERMYSDNSVINV